MVPALQGLRVNEGRWLIGVIRQHPGQRAMIAILIGSAGTGGDVTFLGVLFAFNLALAANPPCYDNVIVIVSMTFAY